MDRVNELMKRVLEEFPRFRLKRRDHSWMKPFFWLMHKVTGRDYNEFTTTIFSTVYVGPSWDGAEPAEQYATLRHELCHIRQFHRWPLGRWAWPLNHALLLLCYFFVLPAFFTLRSRFEREGYVQDLLVQYELKGQPLNDLEMEENARWLVDVFSGASYLFMWRRRRAYAWAMDVQRQINERDITNYRDRVDIPGSSRE